MPKLGPVTPEPGPVEAPKLGPKEGVGVVRSAEANRPAERPPIGVVPPSEVVVHVKPQGPASSFGVVTNIVSAAPPPPPPPKPLGVMQPEATFPPTQAPSQPRIGAVNDRVVTPAPVAANVPEKPGAETPVVIVPNVVDPFAGREEKK